MCKGFQHEVLKFTGRMAYKRTSFRDWVMLMSKSEITDDFVTRWHIPKTQSISENVQSLSWSRHEWEAIRQCLDICSRADSDLRKNVRVTENYGTWDALTFMISVHGKFLDNESQGLGWKSRQVGG